MASGSDSATERVGTAWRNRLRLGSGLVLGVFVVGHLVNTALGLVSLETMEAWRRTVHVTVWHGLPGTVLLYGALAVHIALAFWSVYRRAHFRMRPWKAAQLLLGLLIPLLIAQHAIGARWMPEVFGFDGGYPFVLDAVWLGGLWPIVKQSLLLVVVWLHLCVGLHFWLRLKPWYPAAAPWLYALALLLPTLAWLGYAQAGGAMARLAEQPGWLETASGPWWNAIGAAPAGTRDLVFAIYDWAPWIAPVLLALVLVPRAIRQRHTSSSRIRVRYPGGRVVTVPAGASLLEASRAAGIPHASVCGGRGRCTTCRVRVNAGLQDLPPPDALEAEGLARIKAVPGVRLACLTRPRRDVAIAPLLSPKADARDGRRPGGLDGREREVAIMFVDLRGSTKLGQNRLPYDVVFILNQFFSELAEALAATGGHYAQFNGDGLMALYGLESDLASGARAAVAGAMEMRRRLARLNESLGADLDEPLRMGIGVHCGVAIVGTMGPPASPIISAIGDNVNIAARLENMTKDLDCDLVLSRAVAEAAGLDLSGHPTHSVALRGRAGELEVHAVRGAVAMEPMAPGPPLA